MICGVRGHRRRQGRRASRSPTAPPATRPVPSWPAQKADEVHLSLEPDVTRLVDEGLVAEDWKDNDTKGICTSSVVVFVVQKGNPKGIETWDDLVRARRRHRDPEPRLLRLGQVEPARGVRRGEGRGRQRRGRAGVHDEVLRQRRRAARQRSRRHHGVHQRHRRRAPLLRERGDPRPPERPGLRLRDPGRDPAHREPVRGHRRTPRRRPRTSWTSRRAPRARSCTPRPATARSSTSATSRSRAPTTRATRTRSRPRCSPSTVTSVAGPRPTPSTSATARGEPRHPHQDPGRGRAVVEPCLLRPQVSQGAGRRASVGRPRGTT